MRCKNSGTSFSSDRTHSHRLFYERHLPSHLACLAVIISNCFFSCPYAQQSPSPESEPKMLRQWLFGSDGDPTPRGVVGFVFSRWCCATSQCCSLSFSQESRPGLKKLAACRLSGVRGRNIRRGDSWQHVGEPVGALRGGSFFSHVYLGATASDLGV